MAEQFNHPYNTLTDAEQENRIKVFDDTVLEMPLELQLLFRRVTFNLSMTIQAQSHCTQVTALKYAKGWVAALFYQKYLQAPCVKYFEACHA